MVISDYEYLDGARPEARSFFRVGVILTDSKPVGGFNLDAV